MCSFQVNVIPVHVGGFESQDPLGRQVMKLDPLIWYPTSQVKCAVFPTPKVTPVVVIRPFVGFPGAWQVTATNGY